MGMGHGDGSWGGGLLSMSMHVRTSIWHVHMGIGGGGEHRAWVACIWQIHIGTRRHIVWAYSCMRGLGCVDPGY